MKKNIFLFLIVLWLTQSPVFGGLIINSDAESHFLTGWTLSGEDILQRVVSQQQYTDFVNPAGTEHFFNFARGGGSDLMLSHADLLDPDVGALTLCRCYQSNYANTVPGSYLDVFHDGGYLIPELATILLLDLD